MSVDHFWYTFSVWSASVHEKSILVQVHFGT